MTEMRRRSSDLSQYRDVKGFSQTIADVRATRKSWPAPTVDQPDLEEIIEWSHDGEMESTDGCGETVEDDGYCEHGHPSWMLQLGLI